MKKYLLLLIASLLCMCLMTCCGTQNSSTDNSGYTLEAKTYPMRMQLDSKKDPVENEITLYFVNGGDIPYVALSEYMPFVGSIYEDPYLGIPAASYEITKADNNHTFVKRTDNESMMDINTENDTIDFVGMDYFTATPGSSVFLSIITLGEEGRGGVSNMFKDTGFSYDRIGNALLTFDMSEYMIDLIEKDGECYIPLQTINDLLVSQNYVYVVFTGEKVLACASSSNLIDEMYDAPTGVMSEDFALFNYNELRFMLDSFYGLKSEHDIENFGDFFGSTGLLKDLSGTDPKTFDLAIRRLTTKYFDDGHSALVKPSYLTGELTPETVDEKLAVFDDLGTSTNAMTFQTIQTKIRRAAYYPDYPELDPYEGNKDAFFYEEVGDTAIITFDRFSTNKKDYYKEADLTNPQDTIELISYAHSQITRENSPIKNVVLDLSCNYGGTADAAIFLIAWFKDKAQISLKDRLTGAQSNCSYMADINLDGEFDFDDYLPYEINKYCLISSLSFSCGNLVPAAFKGTSGITLLGRTSGGGACVVRTCTTASGTIFTISSNKQLSYIKNGSLYNVDQGVEPDYVLTQTDSFYNRQKLVDYIHTLP